METKNRLLHEQDSQTRVRLLLQTMQKRNAQEISQRKQRKLSEKSKGKERKGTTHNSNSFNKTLLFLWEKNANSKTSFATEGIGRPRQGQLNRIMQAMSWTGTQNNYSDFVANCIEQQKGGLTFGISLKI